MKTGKSLVVILMFTLGIIGHSCKSTKQSAGTESTSNISYATDLKPLMERSCAPCHFPDGKKVKLDTYEATKNHIKEIIARMELPADDPGYMPFKSKKPAMTKEEIEKFKEWASHQMKP